MGKRCVLGDSTCVSLLSHVAYAQQQAFPNLAVPTLAPYQLCLLCVEWPPNVKEQAAVDRLGPCTGEECQKQRLHQASRVAACAARICCDPNNASRFKW
eukprot:5590754-Amphidinium_carterae.1